MRHRPLSTPLATALAFLAFLTVAAASVPAHAHAILVDSSPKDNAVLSAPPREVVLRFNARIEKRISRITLLDGAGRTVPLPPSPKRHGDGPPDRLVISLPPLRPGAYRLQYRILATDGHATLGLLRFTVSGGGGP